MPAIDAFALINAVRSLPEHVKRAAGCPTTAAQRCCTLEGFQSGSNAMAEFGERLRRPERADQVENLARGFCIDQGQHLLSSAHPPRTVRDRLTEHR